MWRTVTTVLMLVSITGAQTVGTNPASDIRPASEGSLVARPAFAAPGIVVSAYQRYSGFRRGHEQEIEVVLCSSTAGAEYCQYGSRLNQETLVPLALELSAAPGFSVSYRQGSEYRTQPQGVPLEIGGRKVILLKLSTRQDVPLGPHLLEGRLRFLAGDQGPGGAWAGNGVVQEITVKVPVVIVEHDSQVAEVDDWPTSRHASRKLAQLPNGFVSVISVVAVQALRQAVSQ